MHLECRTKVCVEMLSLKLQQTILWLKIVWNAFSVAAAEAANFKQRNLSFERKFKPTGLKDF